MKRNISFEFFSSNSSSNLKRIVRQTSARRQKIIAQGRVTRRASLICRSLPSRFSLTAEIVFRGTLRVFTFLVEVSKDRKLNPIN